MSALSHRVRSTVRHLRKLIRFWQFDRHKGGPVELKLLRQGFVSLRRRLYAFDQYDPHWFLSDWAIENNIIHINSAFVKAQLNDKLYFHFLLRELGEGDKMGHLIGLVSEGVFTSFSPFDSVESALLQHPRIIVKPVDGIGGFGVRVIEKASDLQRHGICILEAAIQQHAYAQQIFSGSVNTIRVMTLRPNSGEPFILGAAHRFGVKKSAPVDNLSSGGITAAIDVPTGRLSAAMSSPGSFADLFHARHPETQSPIEGVIIPSWPEIKAFVLDLARKVPGLKIAGWDVSLTAEGPRLIEANGSVPNPELFQFKRPLLLDPPTRAFFAEQRVIPKKLVDKLDRLEALGQTKTKG